MMQKQIGNNPWPGKVVYSSCRPSKPSDSECANGGSDREHRRLPRWLKRNIPKGTVLAETTAVLKDLQINTVCQAARCPNRMECFSHRTATFMILGNTCTRNCRFCAVNSGSPLPPDPSEPERVAQAALRLGLKHVVITCVTRDDLADGGADHFCRTIEWVRRLTNATVEVLPSDLGGSKDALLKLIKARPDVYNYNTETVPRLYPVVRNSLVNYRWTLEIFRTIKERDASIRTKTGIMLGLGETTDEVLETLAELASAGCDMVTIGQYLQPDLKCIPVVRYVPPEEFAWLEALAYQLGFQAVVAGPFVRSSYHAAEMLRCSHD